jgi:hypothetical protein
MSRRSSGPVLLTCTDAALVWSKDMSRSIKGSCSLNTSRCSSGHFSIDTLRNSKGSCCAGTFRCSSDPCCADVSQVSTGFFCPDKPRCSSGPCWCRHFQVKQRPLVWTQVQLWPSGFKHFQTSPGSCFADSVGAAQTTVV